MSIRRRSFAGFELGESVRGPGDQWMRSVHPSPLDPFSLHVVERAIPHRGIEIRPPAADAAELGALLPYANESVLHHVARRVDRADILASKSAQRVVMRTKQRLQPRRVERSGRVVHIIVRVRAGAHAPNIRARARISPSHGPSIDPPARRTTRQSINSPARISCSVATSGARPVTIPLSFSNRTSGRRLVDLWCTMAKSASTKSNAIQRIVRPAVAVANRRRRNHAFHEG